MFRPVIVGLSRVEPLLLLFLLLLLLSSGEMENSVNSQSELETSSCDDEDGLLLFLSSVAVCVEALISIITFFFV